MVFRLRGKDEDGRGVMGKFLVANGSMAESLQAKRSSLFLGEEGGVMGGEGREQIFGGTQTLVLAKRSSLFLGEEGGVMGGERLAGGGGSG